MQMQLQFGKARRSMRSRYDDDIRALVGLLSRHSTRLTAGEIGSVLGWTDRHVRAVAEAAGGQVLSAPGISGYRLAAATPVAEYYAQERLRYRSQIKAMTDRLLAMDRAVHAAHEGQVRGERE